MQTRAATPESEKFQLASVALLTLSPPSSYSMCWAVPPSKKLEAFALLYRELTLINHHRQTPARPSTGLQKQTEPASDGPAWKANAVLSDSTLLAILFTAHSLQTLMPSKKPCQRSFLSALLPKQHMCSRLVSRAKQRVRVRLISHADLLCQGSDPVLVRKQTRCLVPGSVTPSHPSGKPVLCTTRARSETGPQH